MRHSLRTLVCCGGLLLVATWASGCDLFGGGAEKATSNKPDAVEVTVGDSELEYLYYTLGESEGSTKNGRVVKKVVPNVDSVPAAHRRAIAVWKLGIPLHENKRYVADLTGHSSGDAVTAELRSNPRLKQLHAAIDRAESRAEGRRAQLSTVVRAATAEPFLWRVRADDGSTLYLFGTAHTENLPRREKLAPQVRLAFKRSRRFVMEASLEKKPPRDEVFLPPGETLRRKIGDRAWNKLKQQFAGKLPAGPMNRMRPWIVTTTLLKEIAGRRQGMDRQLREWAEVDEKTVLFLESMQKQLDVAQERLDAEALRETVLHMEKAREEYERLKKAYKQRDVDTIRGITSAGDGPLDPTPAEVDMMLEERNREWIPKFDSYLDQSGPTFAAVGVGHLVGPDHVVGMLREEGYDVKRLD